MLNFGIIGYGAIGEIHARTIEKIKDAKVAAIADKTKDGIGEAIREYGCEIYTDYTEMLKRDDIDIVNVCLPSGMHYQAAMAAAEAGKHCIIEKPMAISVEHAESMIEAFDRRGLKLSVIFQHRFDKSTQLIKEAISYNTLGKLNYGTSTTRWFRDDEYYNQSDWRGTWRGDGGGALMNQAIHSIDLLQYLMGPVEAVCGTCAALYHQGIETEDLGVALLKFKNGAMGTVEGTTLAYPGFHSGVSIFGQSGMASIVNDKLDFYQFKSGIDQKLEELKEKGDEQLTYGWYNLVSHKRQFEDVMDAVTHNRQPLVTGDEGLKSLKIIKGIYESSEKNEWVEIK